MPWWIWFLRTHSFSLYKTLINGLKSCWLLRCFYQLFGFPFWRHPFTAEDPLVRKQHYGLWLRNQILLQMLNFFKSVPMKKYENFHFWVNNYLFKPDITDSDWEIRYYCKYDAKEKKCMILSDPSLVQSNTVKTKCFASGSINSSKHLLIYAENIS